MLREELHDASSQFLLDCFHLEIFTDSIVVHVMVISDIGVYLTGDFDINACRSQSEWREMQCLRTKNGLG